jgi:hypothetical protein
MFGTQRPLVVLHVANSPQPSSAVQFATHFPLEQKLAVHSESDVHDLSQSGGGFISVAQVRAVPPEPPLPNGGPSELPPPQANKKRPETATSTIESQQCMYELPNIKKPTMPTFYTGRVTPANQASPLLGVIAVKFQTLGAVSARCDPLRAFSNE